MLSVDIQKLLKDGESRYELVAATAKRARMIVDDIQNKNKNTIKVFEKSSDKSDKVQSVEKPVSIAVKEFEEGKWSIVHHDA